MPSLTPFRPRRLDAEGGGIMQKQERNRPAARVVALPLTRRAKKERNK